MPNRILKESLCYSDDVDQLTAFEETVFIRLIVNCDDFGRLDARPSFLKSRLFVTKKGITEKNVEEAIQKLASVGLIQLYQVDGKSFLLFPKWDKHQQMRAKQSKYPEPEIICNPMISNDSKCPRNPIQSESESNPNRNKAGKPPKNKYGEYKNVLLSQNDLEKLKAKWPNSYLEKIEELSRGIELKGYKYKNHYLAILEWNKEKAPDSEKTSQRTYDLQAYEDMDFLSEFAKDQGV